MACLFSVGSGFPCGIKVTSEVRSYCMGGLLPPLIALSLRLGSMLSRLDLLPLGLPFL
ncbi:MAG: hypothetical protein R3Y63_15505 [Eubacteriales bacterium]